MKLITDNTVDLDKHITIDLTVNELLHILAGVSESHRSAREAFIAEHLEICANDVPYLYTELVKASEELTHTKFID